MTNEESRALLVMDVQPGIVDRIQNKETYLSNLKRVIAAAHEQSISVIHVVVGFRAGFPEVSLRNKSFGTIKKNAPAAMTNPSPAIMPEEGDVVVTKRRVSAFSGSDLEVLLRAGGIGHLILTGIATSGVVLSTVREAADKDFRLTVLSDLCADFDDEVHSILIGKVFPRQATVLTGDEWIKNG